MCVYIYKKKNVAANNKRKALLLIHYAFCHQKNKQKKQKHITGIYFL